MSSARIQSSVLFSILRKDACTCISFTRIAPFVAALVCVGGEAGVCVCHRGVVMQR